MDVGRRCRRTAVSLPEDAIIEILVRVEDEADLFRCAVTCRPWKRLVAEASFLRRRWPDQDTSGSRTSPIFLAGYIAETRLANGGYYCLETFFVPTARSVLGHGSRPLGSFFPEAAARLLNNAEILMARHGLLLMRLMSPSPLSVLKLAVCNMLTGVCYFLPPLDCNRRFGEGGYAILTGADYSSNSKQQPSAPPGNSAFFKVLILENHSICRYLRIHTISCKDHARWSTPTKCPIDDTPNKGDRFSLSRPEAVVCNGTAHWLVTYKIGESFNWCTLDIDTETCCASLTRIEIPRKYLYSYNFSRLSVIKDMTLSVIYQQSPFFRVLIWTRQHAGKSEGGGAKWVHTHVVELKPAGEESKSLSLMVSMDEKCGKLLVDDKQNNIVYLGDLETGAMEKMEKVMGWSNGRYIHQKGVLLEMDWPSFFACRLGSL